MVVLSHDEQDAARLASSFVSDLPLQEKERLEVDLDAFIVKHSCHHRPIALVTSGGTVADLELNSVRCLDNFSTGTRGAISVELLLKRGYSVIHLWRKGSASPYARLLHHAMDGTTLPNHGISCHAIGKLFAASSTGDVEDEQEDQLVQSVLDDDDPFLTNPTPYTTTTASSSSSKKKKRSFENGSGGGGAGIQLHRRIVDSSRLQTALKERKVVVQEGRLLTIPFRSVEEYIAKLQMCATSLQNVQSLALLYLAAAVSDFYVPKDLKSPHKIQSSSSSSSSSGGTKGGLTLELHPVPKVMGLLTKVWCPNAFVCSFKLETDQQLLRQKAERAITNYACDMVIGNLLHTRHDQVWILAPEATFDDDDENKEDEYPEPKTKANVRDWPMKQLTKPRGTLQTNHSDALEDLIIEEVIQSHFEYISVANQNHGSDAVLAAHEQLEQERRRLQKKLFWKQIKATGMEWGGVLLGCGLSYVISSALRKRMGA